MHQDVANYIAAYPPELQALFLRLRALVLESAPDEVTERLWAKLPSYFCGKRFVRLIPFQDHINVEAAGLALRAAAFAGFSFTAKGMLQVRPGQTLPERALSDAFRATLCESSPPLSGRI